MHEYEPFVDEFPDKIPFRTSMDDTAKSFKQLNRHLNCGGKQLA